MKQAPRFALAAPPDGSGIARVDGEEAHHMRDVMRLKPGDEVVLIDKAGTLHCGTIRQFDRAGASVHITSIEPARPRATVIVAAAIVKGPRMDFIVEKAAELGATELWPVVCARTIGKAPGAERVSRWRRLATAASKQSLAAPPMHLREPLPFASLIRNVPHDTLALVCSAGAEPMMEALARRRPWAILVATGPEGDFTPDELESAVAAGFAPVGLGANRLRSETAALAALAIARQSLDRQSS